MVSNNDCKLPRGLKRGEAHNFILHERWQRIMDPVCVWVYLAATTSLKPCAHGSLTHTDTHTHTHTPNKTPMMRKMMPQAHALRHPTS
eukprot:6472943-Amphidinium_carterae.1